MVQDRRHFCLDCKLPPLFSRCLHVAVSRPFPLHPWSLLISLSTLSLMSLCPNQCLPVCLCTPSQAKASSCGYDGGRRNTLGCRLMICGRPVNLHQLNQSLILESVLDKSNSGDILLIQPCQTTLLVVDPAPLETLGSPWMSSVASGTRRRVCPWLQHPTRLAYAPTATIALQ